MTSRFTELAIDCADPHALARFWCSALGYQVYEMHDEAGEDATVTIGPADERGGAPRRGPVPPTLTFAFVPEGKTVKNRLHLDITPGDMGQHAEVGRLLALGAKPADIGQGEKSWVVLFDPEGNEFCVLAGRHR